MGGGGGGTSDFGGGGVGGGGGGGGGGTGSGGDCTTFRARTVIASPVPGVAGALVIGNTLRLELTNGGPPIVALNQAGATAGSVTPRGLAELVDCMIAGNKYRATVVGVNGGAITVLIEWEGV